MQTSAMMGVLAIAVPVGHVVMQAAPRVGTVFWGVVLLVVGSVLMFAGFIRATTPIGPSGE